MAKSNKRSSFADIARGKASASLAANTGAVSFGNSKIFNYRDSKEYPVGTTFILRILSLADGHFCRAESRKLSIINPKNQSMMSIPVPLPLDDNGEVDVDYLEDKEDHAGNDVLNAKSTYVFGMPVWVYAVKKPNGEEVEINKPMWMEFTIGLWNSLVGIRDNSSMGAYAWNSDTQRPDYDLFLQIIPGKGNATKMYEFEPVAKKVKIAGMVIDNLEVDAFDVFDEEQIEEIEEFFEEDLPKFVEGMFSHESFEKELGISGFKNEKSAERKSNLSVDKQKPEPDEDEDDDDDADDDDGEEEEEPTTGRKRKRSGSIKFGQKG